MLKFNAKEIFPKILSKNMLSLYNLSKYNHTFKIFGRHNEYIRKNNQNIEVSTNNNQNNGKLNFLYSISTLKFLFSTYFIN